MVVRRLASFYSPVLFQTAQKFNLGNILYKSCATNYAINILKILRLEKLQKINKANWVSQGMFAVTWKAYGLLVQHETT